MCLKLCVFNDIFLLYVFAMWILNSMMILAPAHVFTSTSWTFGLALWDPVTCCEVGYSLHGRSYANWSWWVGVSAQVHRGFLYVHVSSERRDSSECLERSYTCSKDLWTHGPPRGTESGEPTDLAFALRRGCKNRDFGFEWYNEICLSNTYVLIKFYSLLEIVVFLEIVK